MKKLILIAILSLVLVGCAGDNNSEQKSNDESIVITVQSPISNSTYDTDPVATYEVTEGNQVVSDFETQKSLNDEELQGFVSGDTLPAVEGYNEFIIEFKNLSVVIPFDLVVDETIPDIEKCKVPPIKGDKDKLERHLDCVKNVQ